MEFNIALIKGDGIGPEISLEAVKVLEETGRIFSHNFNITCVTAAGEAVDKFNNPLPEDSIASCIKSDAILFANLSGSKWANNPIEKMPEKSLVELRRIINTTLNIRPIDLRMELAEFSPLKPGIIGIGMDTVVVRDIIGGMINGEKRRCSGPHGKEASDLEYYNEEIVREVAEYGFELAQNRNKYLVSLDKANVLASSKLWRETVNEAAKSYPDVRVEHILVDNAAMEVLKRPGEFDVDRNNFNGKIIEFCGSSLKYLSLEEKTTLCNLAAETGAISALMNDDESNDDEYSHIFKCQLSSVLPMAVLPDSYNKIAAVDELPEIKVNEAFIGGCAGGSIEDLRAAADIVRGKSVSKGVRLMIAPKTSQVYIKALDEGLIADFINAGAIVMNQGCSVCYGKSQGIVDDGEVLVSAGSYNLKGCAGSGYAKIYVVSAKTAAASAISGKISAKWRD